MNKKEEFNKKILKTVEENDSYAMTESFFLDSGKYPDMYDSLIDCFSIFWTPRSYKDIQIAEKIKEHRKEYFGEGHVRSEYASLGDLVLYMAKEAKKQLKGTKLEDHLQCIFKSLGFYRMDIHEKRQIAKLVSTNAYYFENTDGQMLYSMFGFPRSEEEHRLVKTSIVKQYVFLYKKGRYVKGVYVDNRKNE